VAVNSEFWQSDDDDAVLARYLAEHSYESGMSDGMFVIGVGDADLLPPLERTGPEQSVCARCGTAVTLLADAGWRHVDSLRVRRGCTVVWPR
jgi:hypothetical protein